MAAIDWPKIKEQLDQLTWEKVSDRWETRKVALGLTRASDDEDTLNQLDDEASRHGMFLEFDDDAPEHLYAAQGRSGIL